MTTYRLTTLAMWLPVILTALGVILVITLRWFSYKERMALIAQGLEPERKKSTEERTKTLLAAGLIVGLVGIALTIALLTLGVGVWLLLGLLPLFVGLALVLTSLVLRPAKAKSAPTAQEEGPAAPPTTTFSQEVLEVEAEENAENPA